MSVKISDMPELTTAVGQEEVPLAFNNRWYKVKLSTIADLVTKDSLGLDKVDNTADLDKPISNSTQEALDNKSNKLHTHAISEVVGLEDALLSKASAGDVTAIQEQLANISANINVSVDTVEGLSDALASKANKSEVPTLDQFNNQTETIQTLSSAIQLLETNLGSKLSHEQLLTILASYATKAELENLTAIVNSKADGQTVAMAIQELTETVNLKASQSALDDLTTIVEGLVANPCTVTFSEPQW